jgi:hypothetical protein
MTEKAMGQNIVLKFDHIGYNVDLPKGRFDMPDAVRAMAEKKKQ